MVTINKATIADVILVYAFRSCCFLCRCHKSSKFNPNIRATIWSIALSSVSFSSGIPRIRFILLSLTPCVFFASIPKNSSPKEFDFNAEQ